MIRFFFVFLFCLFPLLTHAAETRGLRVVAKDHASGQTGEVKLYNKSYAVIIGIDRYKDLPPDRQLKNAVKDAKGVEAAIRKQYRFDRIFTLHDQQASRDAIMRLLTAELPQLIGKDDALFVFWAGHGNQVKTDDGDLGYLIPYDGNGDGIYGNITMSQLKDDISRAIPAKHIFYAFDACYSGLLTTRAVDAKVSRNLAYLKTITKERVRQVLTAGSRGQEALDNGPHGHSVFTGRLIEVLEATDDYITANEIQAILKERVYQDARARGHEQTPGFGALYGGGDFVFVPNVEQKVQDNKAELARLEAELKQLESREAEARKYHNQQQQREAEQQKKAAEARLKAEQLRQQQLAEEAKRQQEMVQERARFEAEQKQRDQQQRAAQLVEEQRLAVLKAELAKKKQTAPVSTGSLAAAVAEIKRLNADISGIEATFSQELTAGTQRITARYDKEITAVRVASQQQQAPLVRDEFETAAEFKARQVKHEQRFNERISQLQLQQQQEIDALKQRLTQAQLEQTKEHRQSLQQLTNKSFTVGAESLAVELGTYDPDKQIFSVSISSKIPEVKLVVNSNIMLPKDEAKVLKQSYLNGMIRLSVHLNSLGGFQKIILVDNSYGMEYELSDRLTKTKMTLPSFRASKEKMRFVCQNNVFFDYKTGLSWLCDAGMSKSPLKWREAIDWLKSLTISGYNDWRLPTKEEMESLFKKESKKPYEWLNSNGFNNVQPYYYWTTGVKNGQITSWYLNMKNGLSLDGVNTLHGFVWPVRDAK